MLPAGTGSRLTREQETARPRPSTAMDPSRARAPHPRTEPGPRRKLMLGNSKGRRLLGGPEQRTTAARGAQAQTPGGCGRAEASGHGRHDPESQVGGPQRGHFPFERGGAEVWLRPHSPSSSQTPTQETNTGSGGGAPGGLCAPRTPQLPESSSGSRVPCSSGPSRPRGRDGVQAPGSSSPRPGCCRPLRVTSRWERSLPAALLKPIWIRTGVRPELATA